jgi:hypothetical protein
MNDYNFKELREMVQEMLAADDKGFNDWEINFLDDMSKKDIFTENQANKIEQIYKRKM